MIFLNPSGAPELACNECGCRWFNRMTNCCYECGADILQHDIEDFESALRVFTENRMKIDSTIQADLTPGTRD
jgi:hypothetical protein